MPHNITAFTKSIWIALGTMTVAIIFTIFFWPDSRENKIIWTASFNEALVMAQEREKPILVVFYSEQCPDCEALWDACSNPAAAEATENILSVKVDINKEPELAKRYGVNRVPAVLILHMSGKKAGAYTGNYEPRDLWGFVKTDSNRADEL